MSFQVFASRLEQRYRGFRLRLRLRIVLEAYQRPPTPLSILTLRNRLRLPKVRTFVDFLQQRWMHPRPPL